MYVEAAWDACFHLATRIDLSTRVSISRRTQSAAHPMSHQTFPSYSVTPATLERSMLRVTRSWYGMGLIKHGAQRLCSDRVRPYLTAYCAALHARHRPPTLSWQHPICFCLMVSESELAVSL